jgi:hypothetical protein
LKHVSCLVWWRIDDCCPRIASFAVGPGLPF